MSTSNELEAQVAELMKRLAKTKEAERRAAEEEEVRKHEELEQCW